MSSEKKKRRVTVWRVMVSIFSVVGALVFFGLAAMGVMGLMKGKQGGPDTSLTAAVKRGDLRVEVIETGKVQPPEKVEVKSKVAGQVTKVYVVEGQRVKRGQPLLRLDPTDYQREVERCQADVDAARLAVEFAQLTLERRQKGLAERAVAQTDVDFATNDLASKKVAQDRAKVALVAARDKLAYTRIDAPIDGVVIEKGIQEGEVVTPGVQATFEGKALLTVADLSRLTVKADLNQIDIAKVKLEQTVTLTLDALPGKSYEAKITKVAPASTLPKGKEVDVFPVEATILKVDGEIKPGMTADVRILTDVKKAVLTLPIEAVVKEKGKSYVQVVKEAEKGKKAPPPEKLEVKVGVRNDREVEIQSGVSEGQKILIKPASASENEFKG